MRKKLIVVVAILIVIFIVYNLIGRIFGALKAGNRLTEAVDRLQHIEIKNKELKEQLKEAASTDFIERAARDKLGLAKEGETVVIIPENKIMEVLGATKKVTEERLPNWQGWLRLFFN